MPRAAFYLPLNNRRCLAVWHTPALPVAQWRGACLCLPPFAEELNCARRVLAEQARRMAEAGIAVLQIDLSGTGDSEGAFADAAWSDWKAEVAAAWSWLQAETNVPCGVWAIRTGALLAGALPTSSRDVGRPFALYWQPVLQGALFLRQFLRLRVLADRLAGRDATSVDQLLQQSAAGEVIDVAGYQLSPGLVSGLLSATADLPSGECGIGLFEAGRGSNWSPPLAAWAGQAQGLTVTGGVLDAPLFWQSIERTDASRWHEASLRWLDGGAHE